MDEAFLCNYQATQDQDGTYTTRFPWKSDHPYLPSKLVSRLKESPTLLHLYNNIILDQVKKGFFIEKLPSDHRTGNLHYLPHHPAKKRLCDHPHLHNFYGSYRQGKGLTSLIHMDPPFLDDLWTILASCGFQSLLIQQVI